MPVKNEVDILPSTLDTISTYCDVIIIADQMSTDGSRDLYKKYPKVVMIDNTREGHSNEVRWDLLKKAREFGHNNFILCLDADEYISSKIFQKFYENQVFKVGQSFMFPWIQLWKNQNLYNDQGVWYKNYQRAAWVDDGVTNYSKDVVINDHVARVPPGFLKNIIKVKNVPIVHLQWLFWNKTQLKQAWYRCSELIKNPLSFKEINFSYFHSLNQNIKKLKKTPENWINEYAFDKINFNKINNWHKESIFNFFDKYGISFFEPLQIWHIGVLRDEFFKRTGRLPVSKKTSFLKVCIKNTTEKIKRTIKDF